MLYAVGDIHGELDKLDILIEKLHLEDGDRLVFLGDYVDRGPQSFGVVERLIELQRHFECIFLLGNHESMFLDFLGWRGKPYFGKEAFLANGGDRTLESYGYFDEAKPTPGCLRLPLTHEAFYRGCRLHYQEGDYLFVHAGLPRKLLEGQDLGYVLKRSKPQHLLWDRSTGDLPHALGVTVVYGHTPRADFSVAWNEPFSIGIDTGATYGGPLTAIRLPDETIFQT